MAATLSAWLFLGVALPAAALSAPEAPRPAAAKPAPQPEAKTWTLNLRDVDIHAFLSQVSAITGDNFVVDPQVSGKVTVIATAPLGPNAVHELFLTVLRVNGFAAVPSGATTRIVPLAGVHGGAVARGPVSGQQLVTRVIPAKDVNIEDAIRMLKPMVSPAGFLEGSVYSNALVVSDYADNVNQIASALDSLG
ncbi:MAG: type II secretion system protein GspD, partial [Proteobacteria bacterium]|nr:type II secretion system protein GspD [Pseudomonadota bacterium]